MCGWAEAVARAGAREITVVQRFARDARGSPRFGCSIASSPTRRRAGDAHARASSVRLRPDAVHSRTGWCSPRWSGLVRIRAPRHTAIPLVPRITAAFACRGKGCAARRTRLLYRLGLGPPTVSCSRRIVPGRAVARRGVIRARHAEYEVLESSTDMASSAGGRRGRLPGDPAIL
jgi:hypothetical protein